MRFDDDFRGVVGIYDDGTFEFLDCSESERKKKEEAYAKAEKEPLYFMHTVLEGKYNPRYQTAFSTLGKVMFVTMNFVTRGSGGIEYFGEGEPWEPDPEMEGVVF